MFLTVKEASDLTGKSATTIYRLCNKRRNSVYIRKEDNKFLIDKEFLLASYPLLEKKISDDIARGSFDQDEPLLPPAEQLKADTELPEELEFPGSTIPQRENTEHTEENSSPEVFSEDLTLENLPVEIAKEVKEEVEEFSVYPAVELIETGEYFSLPADEEMEEETGTGLLNGEGIEREVSRTNCLGEIKVFAEPLLLKRKIPDVSETEPLPFYKKPEFLETVLGLSVSLIVLTLLLLLFYLQVK